MTRAKLFYLITCTTRIAILRWLFNSETSQAFLKPFNCNFDGKDRLFDLFIVSMDEPALILRLARPEANWKMRWRGVHDWLIVLHSFKYFNVKLDLCGVTRLNIHYYVFAPLWCHFAPRKMENFVTYGLRTATTLNQCDKDGLGDTSLDGLTFEIFDSKHYDVKHSFSDTNSDNSLFMMNANVRSLHKNQG